MGIISTAIRHMFAAGMSSDQVMAAVEEMEGSRSTSTERVRRHRARCNDETLHVSVDQEKEVSPAPLPEKDPPLKENPPTGVKRKRGSRLPEGWRPSSDAELYAQKLGFSAFEIASMAEDMRLWAAAASGPAAVKLDWESAFKGWIRREKAKNGVRGNRPSNVIQGSFRKEFSPVVEPKKISEEERQANLIKLKGALKQSIDIERPCDTEGPDGY